MSTAPVTSTFSRIGLTALVCLSLLGSPVLVCAQEEIVCEKPLREQDVGKLLKGQTPEARIKQLLASCGIDFEVTAETEQRFRQLGGTDGVILALTRAPRHDPAPRVLHRAIEAMGGLDALRNLRDLVSTETISGGGEKWTIRDSYQAPDKIREDASLGPGHVATTILNGTSCSTTTHKGFEPCAAQYAEFFHERSRRKTELLLLDAATGNRKVELVGSGVVNGNEVDILLVAPLVEGFGPRGASRVGEPIKLYVDRGTGRIFKKSYWLGDSIEVEALYSDFRRAGSLVVPFVWVTLENSAKVSDSSVTSFVVNTGVDPSVFLAQGESPQGVASRYGMVSVTALGRDGIGISGASVRLHHPSTGWVQTGTTDTIGNSTFSSVPPGVGYVISVEKSGFAAVTLPDLVLRPNGYLGPMVGLEMQSVARSGARNGLTLREVVNLLEAGVVPGRVATIVQERGVGFNLTTSVESRLRAAGATDELLDAIAQSRK